MIEATCIYLSLSEVPSLRAEAVYREFVRPFDYEGGLVRHAVYRVIGTLTRLETTWLFVAERDPGARVTLVPAVHFAFEWSSLPQHWEARLVPGALGGLELLPRSLVRTPGWFERYCDDDPRVVELVARELRGEPG